MVVFWQGYRYVAILAGLLPIGVNFLLSYPTSRPASLPVGLACLLAAGVCATAWQVLRRRPGEHTLYALPLWVWAVVYVGLGVWCLVNAVRP